MKILVVLLQYTDPQKAYKTQENTCFYYVLLGILTSEAYKFVSIILECCANLNGITLIYDKELFVIVHAVKSDYVILKESSIG